MSTFLKAIGIVALVFVGSLAALVVAQRYFKPKPPSDAELIEAVGRVEEVFGQASEASRRRAALADICTIESCVDLYALDHDDRYPQSLREIISDARQYLRDGLPLDPWGNEYVYKCPGAKHRKSYDVFSAGPDGTSGTSDDVTPW